jgi:long-subunit fatty acid transport protein
MDEFVRKANGKVPTALDAFTTSPAFNLYLIDTVPGTNDQYFSPFSSRPLNVVRIVDSEGVMGETDLSFAGNYSEKLFIGGTIAFQKIRYAEKAVYQETEQADTVAGFNSFYVSDYHTTKGSGVGFKFGLIFKPKDWIRLGGAVHSPVYFNLQDNYRTDITAYYDNGQDYTEQSPEGKFDYNLNTPFRALGSVAFVIAKKGLVSADYEMVDYTSANLSSSQYGFSYENEAIVTKYARTGNIKIGTEWRFEEWSLRGGYGMYGNPFASGMGQDISRSTYSGGIGYREENFFIDAAYVYTTWKEKSWPFNPNKIEPVNGKVLNTQIMLTLGVKF